MAAFREVRGKAQEQAPISFLDQKIEPIGACSGYRIASLFLPGHLIPATFFNDFRSLPGTDFPEFFQFRFVIRLLHKLGDADRRLARQDRLSGHRVGRAGGGPATPRKADDHGDDGPTNKAPHSILNLRGTLWLHGSLLAKSVALLQTVKARGLAVTSALGHRRPL
jgi:hypothetical protein